MEIRNEKIIKLTRRGFAFFASKNIAKKLDDKTFLKLSYFFRLGKKLNLNNPAGFNEKIQWLKLYDRNPLYTSLVDKYEVKKYVANIIGEEYIIPTIAVWDTVDDIDFDSLPEQFVLKCTHDSGGLVICKNKSEIDTEKTKNTLRQFFSRDYFYLHREWPYKNVKKRIIAEKFMNDNQNETLLDYKFMCFNGKVECMFVCSDRKSEKGLAVDFYDREWNHMPFTRRYRNSDRLIERPENFDLMIELAEKLSKNIPFVRIDFYEIEHKVYFGEYTFSPGAGFEEFHPAEYDLIIGEWIKLPKKELK